jgi:hypothetical protein
MGHAWLGGLVFIATLEEDEYKGLLLQKGTLRVA